MADKKVTPPLGAFPGAPPQPQAPFLPAPPHQAAPQYGDCGGASNRLRVSAVTPTYHMRYGDAVDRTSRELYDPFSMGGGSPYGVAFGGGAAGGAGGAGQLYAAPPPAHAYDQALAAAAAAQHHPPLNIGQQMYSPAAAMYAAAAGYPGYIGYPVQYYPYYPAAAAAAAAAAMQPSIQPLRPTIMIPNGFEAGARFDGVGQPLLPPAPPGVPPSPAQLAAMAGHQVLWR